MATEITTQTYILPLHPAALTLAASIADKDDAHITKVSTPWSSATVPLDEQHVTVRGSAKVHSDFLGEWPWKGPERRTHES